MTIGEALKRFRHAFKLKQKTVAQTVGVLPQVYSRYENDQRPLAVPLLIKLADAYNVSTDYLLGRSDLPRPNFYDEKDIKDAFAAREELHHDEEQAIKQAVKTALTGVFVNSEFTPQQSEKIINAIVAALVAYEGINPSSRSK